MGDLEFLLLLLAAAAALVRLADLVSIPAPIVLVLGGLAVGLVPGRPTIELEPEVVFLIFLPPLLHAAGWYADPRVLRTDWRPIGLMVAGLVVATIPAIAVVAHVTIDGLSWEAAVVLGAVLAPTDPVAALATFSRLGVPERVRLLVEGEAMLNDAIPLVVFRVATAAAVSGTFSLAEASWELVSAAIGGAAVGLAIGWASTHLVRRIDDQPLAILTTLLTAYAGYVVAEELHVSGVLGAVVSGLYGGWHAHRTFDADTRLSAVAFWRVLTFTLEILLFVLLGTQFPQIVDELDQEVALGSLVLAGLALSATLVVVRMAWLAIPDPGLGDGWRERLITGWSGMRGAISLAAALAVPTAVDERPELIFVTVVVIVVTLVGQGLTLPLLVRVLAVPQARSWSPEEAIARLEAAQSALDRLDELEEAPAGDRRPSEEQDRRLRELYRARFARCQAVLSGGSSATAGDEEDDELVPPLRYAEVRRELIAAERAAIVGLRDRGELRPDVFRVIMRDLDLEEARLASMS